MKDVTVRVQGEVFWIEQTVARHFHGSNLYIKAFSSFSLDSIIFLLIVQNAYPPISICLWVLLQTPFDVAMYVFVFVAAEIHPI